jgi:hypothetical protein
MGSDDRGLAREDVEEGRAIGGGEGWEGVWAKSRRRWQTTPIFAVGPVGAVFDMGADGGGLAGVDVEEGRARGGGERWDVCGQSGGDNVDLHGWVT